MSVNSNDTQFKTPMRWLYLVLGALALLLGGIIYSWSILKAPLADDLGWTTPQLALNYTIMMCVFVTGGFLSGLMSKRVSPRLRLLAAAVLVFIGFFASSRMSADSLWVLYLAYGVCAGLGIGFLYNVSVAVIGGWFADMKGLCSGILLMCFGFSTLIFGGLAGRMINMPSVGWRTTYFVIGCAMTVAILLLAIVLKDAPKQEIPQEEDDAKAGLTEEEKASMGNGTNAPIEYSLTEAMRRLSFWKLFLVFVLIAAIGNCAISFAKDFALFAGAPENLAITMVGLLSVCNGLSRIFGGIIYDRLKLSTTRIIVSIVVILAPLCGIVAIVTGSYMLELITLPLCGMAYGLCPISTAIYPRLFYGEKDYASIYGMMNMHVIPASFTATIAGIVIASTGSYLPVFIMMLAFGAATALLLTTTRRP